MLYNICGSAIWLAEQNVNSLLRGVNNELNETGNSRGQNAEEGADAIGISHGVEPKGKEHDTVRGL